MQLNTMGDISFNVHVDKWSWVYNFTKNGTVRWTDKSNGMGGRGTWRKEGNQVVTRWAGSRTWEEWNLPIDTQAATGQCHMQQGTFGLTAETTALEIGTVTAFTRTPASKAKFLESCTQASAELALAQLKFTGFLSGISIAYGRAFDSHNALVKAINDIQISGDKAADLILGQFLTLSLVFVAGGTGGLIGDTMKKAAKSAGVGEDAFMIDAIKDLAKFSIKGVGGEAIGALANGGRGVQIDGMPLSPAEWQNSANERVSDEMSAVAKSILEWRTAVANDDDSFDAGFDPAAEVDNSLVLKPAQGQPVRLADLPEVNKDQLQNQFEQGWLVAWMPKAKFPGGKSFRFPEGSQNLRDNSRALLRSYGQRIGLANIDALINQFCPRIEMFPPR